MSDKINILKRIMIGLHIAAIIMAVVSIAFFISREQYFWIYEWSIGSMFITAALVFLLFFRRLHILLKCYFGAYILLPLLYGGIWFIIFLFGH